LALNAHAAPATLDQQVLAFNRQALLEQSQHQGLLAPEVTLALPAAAQPRPPCRAGWDIAAQDLRNLLHVRVVARCADGQTPAQDYLLRATLSADVLVMARAVAAGKVLVDDDVELQHRDTQAWSATPCPAWTAWADSPTAHRDG